MDCHPLLSCSKTSPESSIPLTTHLESFWENLPGKMARCSRQGKNGRTLVVCLDPKEKLPTEFLTPNIMEWPNDAVVCSLSQVLVKDSTPPKYFLSSTACEGILRRAEKRGKALPTMLHRALQAVAEGSSEPETPVGKTPSLPASPMDKGGAEIATDRSPTLTCNHEAPISVYSSSGAGYWKEGVGPLRAREQDTHEMLHVVHGTQDPCVSNHTAFTLGRNNGGENVLAFSGKDSGWDATLELAPTMRAMNSLKGNQNSGGSVAVAYGLTTEQSPTGGGQPQACMDTDMIVRRLMPVECERLQGFPDGWTQIPYRGKPADQCPDGARYKALGNSMAVPCMRFIGQRLWKQLTSLSATGSIATSTN